MQSDDNEANPCIQPAIRRWAARARTLAIVYLLVLFFATHAPSSTQPEIGVSDKAIHMSAYLVLTLCMLSGWELTIGGLEPKHFFAIWLVGTVYGAFDEITQIPVGRTCDVHDWFADVFGILCGLVLFRTGRAILFGIMGGAPYRTSPESSTSHATQ